MISVFQGMLEFLPFPWCEILCSRKREFNTLPYLRELLFLSKTQKQEKTQLVVSQGRLKKSVIAKKMNDNRNSKKNDLYFSWKGVRWEWGDLS